MSRILRQFIGAGVHNSTKQWIRGVHSSSGKNHPNASPLQKLSSVLSPEEKKAIFPKKVPTFSLPDVESVMNDDESLQSPDYFQVYNLFTVKDLFNARVHLGHKMGSMNPNMRDFIFGSRFESVIFDLDKTAFHLRQALNFIAHIAYRKGIILFVTRSPSTMHLVDQTAIEVGEYSHCRDYESAILTNSIRKFGGITRLPDLAIFVSTLDTVMAPHKAINDFSKMSIPTVGIVDSNCDPNLITFPIPGNDDSLCAIELYCKLFKEAIMRGKNKRKLVDSQEQNSSKSNPSAS